MAKAKKKNNKRQIMDKKFEVLKRGSGSRPFLQRYYAAGGWEKANGSFRGVITKAGRDRILFKNLFIDFEDNGNVVSGKEDHVFIYGLKPFAEKQCKTGDRVCFKAKAYVYLRKNGKCDFGLTEPLDIRIE